MAHIFRLNKIVAAAFTGVSIPPLIPLILYGSMVLGAKILGIKNYATLENVSKQSVMENISQYVTGSIALGLILAVIAFVIALCIMKKCKRNVNHE